MSLVDEIGLTGALSSTEKAIVTRIISAVTEASKHRGWWATREGKAALNYLQIWGATQRARKESGDMTALPSMVGHGGSRQGFQEGMSGLAMIYESVDRWFVLLGPRGCQEQRLLYWIHVLATVDQAVVVRYQFSDGTFSDPQLASDPEPSSPWDRVGTLFESWVQVESLSKLPHKATEGVDDAFADWGEAGIEYWRNQRSRFLEAMHLALAKRLARDLGL